MRSAWRAVPVFLLWAAVPLPAQTNSAENLPEEKIVTIDCELTAPPKHTEIPVFQSKSEAEKAVGKYTYKLWLPNGYHSDSTKRWPAVFIMSPGGNAGMGAMQPAIRDRICIMLVEAKNGPWEPIVGNFLAAHDDAIKRLRIEEGAKIATGFSGGARGSSVFVQIRPGFSGLILQGAGAAFGDDRNYHLKDIKRNRDLRVAMVMGRSDSNRSEVSRMESEMPRARFEVFEYEGGHSHPPTEVFEKAMEFVTSKGGTAGSTPAGGGGAFDDFFKKK